MIRLIRLVKLALFLSGFSAALAALAAFVLSVGVWRQLPSGPELAQALDDVPQVPTVVDGRGVAVVPPVSERERGGEPGGPVARPDALPPFLLSDLGFSEGMGWLGLGLSPSGVWRELAGRAGSATVPYQVHRLLMRRAFASDSLALPEDRWTQLVGAVAAVKLAQSAPNEDLLAFYANAAQFVSGPLGGIEYAARTKYGTSASALTRPEALRLITCLPAPAECAGTEPSARRDSAYVRLLRRLRATGRMSDEEFDAALTPPPFRPAPAEHFRAGPALDLALDAADEALVALGWRTFGDGLTVEATFRLDLIEAVTPALQRAADSTPGASFASMLVLDPAGRVVVYAVAARSGPDGGTPRSRLAVLDVLRSEASLPASRMKPLLYVAYVEDLLSRGWSVEQILSHELPNAYRRPDGVVVSGCGGRPRVTLATAIRESCNGSAYWVLNEALSPERFAAFLRRLGIGVAPVYTLALGTEGVSELAFAAAYASLFAQEGARLRPRVLDRVLDRQGRAVYDASGWLPASASVAPGAAARIVRSLLGGTVEREQGGTAWRVLGADPSLADWDLALKTGTSESESRYRHLGVSGVVRPPGRNWYSVTVKVEGRLPAGLSAGHVAAPWPGTPSRRCAVQAPSAESACSCTCPVQLASVNSPLSP